MRITLEQAMKRLAAIEDRLETCDRQCHKYRIRCVAITKAIGHLLRQNATSWPVRFCFDGAIYEITNDGNMTTVQDIQVPAGDERLHDLSDWVINDDGG